MLSNARRKFRGAPEDRFVAKVQFGDDTDCWLWLAGKFPTGYGHFHPGKTGHPSDRYAHRFAYRLWVGPIPDGLTIDHLCRNRACVNPNHLEAVTIGENIRRIPYEVKLAHHAKRRGMEVKELADQLAARRALVAARRAERESRPPALPKPSRARVSHKRGEVADAAARAANPNTDNLPGIFQQRNGTWTARAKAGGKRYIIGTFPTPDEAHTAYVAWKTAR